MSLNRLKTLVLLSVLAGILMGVGYLIGGTSGLTIGLVLAILMNFGTYWFSDKIVLKIYRAQEVKKKDMPEYHKTVEEITKAAGIPMPKLYIVPSDAPNAFATGRNPNHAAVACTKGILSLLTKEELKGVLAHEVSHIKNRDILITTIAATIAAVISYVGFMARWAAIFGGGGRDDNRNNLLGIIVLGIITPLIAMLLQLAISRSREYLADETGAKTIKDPKALASALEKIEKGIKLHPMRFGSPATSSLFIENPFSAHGMMALLSTHPPTKSRVERLRRMKV